MRIPAFGLALVLLFSLQAANETVDRGKVLGNLSAPLTLEIFSSYDCPHCKIMHEQDLPRLMQDFVVPGKACIISREFPLPPPAHPYAREAADYATAAARIGKFDAVAEALFRNQMTWALNGKVWDTVSAALTPTERPKVMALAKDPGVIAEVDRDLKAVAAAGINSTPSIVITVKGRRMAPIGNPQTYELLKQYLNSLLAR